MILLIEFLVLCVGLTIFMMQHTLRERISLVGSKVVYWCSMLFVSIVFNSVLFHTYPDKYRLSSYINLSSLTLVIGVVLGYVVIQTLSPSRPYKKIVDKIHKKNKEKMLQKAFQEGDLEVGANEPSQNTYLKELHFETFLETICWLAIMFAMSLEIFHAFMTQIFGIDFIVNSLRDTMCLMMIITIPIILRQIMYYLYYVRGIKEEQDLSEIEVSFYHKLRRRNNRL